MNPTRPFGRRTRPPGRPGAEILELGEAAEAFRRELRSAPAEEDGFAALRRAEGRRFYAVWGLRAALMAPGLLAFALQAPPFLAGMLEIAGALMGMLVRKERRRHLTTLARYDPDGADRPAETAP